MNKINLLFVTVVTIFLFHSLSFGQSIFFDDFDSYTAGGQLACQNPIDWISIPCDPVDDPFISNTYSLSAPNSVVIVQNNDVIKLLGQVTSGKWEMQMHIYIPTGKEGYFNMLSGYPPNPIQWAMEVYFDVGGGGRLENVPGAPIAFTWTEDTWQMVQVIVDLDLDMAEFWFDDWPVPVELTFFTASVNNISEVILNWTTATESNNYGFEIERLKGSDSKWEKIGFVLGSGTTTELRAYSFTDENISSGTYSYRLKQIDFNGTFEYSEIVEVEVGIPNEYSLKQNYPNPFNPTTKIKFTVAESGFTSLKIYDVLGNEVAILVSEEKPAGEYEVEFNGANLPSGIYFYRIKAGSYINTKKMVLLR
jgi:hypothetical protein